MVRVFFEPCVREDATAGSEFSERYPGAMQPTGVPTLGWLSAALLSLVTLFVFGSLRNYGPDSVVRKFHMAALERNWRAATPLVDPDFDSEPTAELWVNLNAILGQYGASYDIQNVQRKPNEAVLVVRYQTPEGERRLIWVVTRKSGVWKIDTRRTTLAARALTNAPTYGLSPLR